MDNSSINQLKEALSKARTIGIVTGKQPSLDEMGAALALYLAVSEGKDVVVASPDEPIVELSSLVGINKVKTSLAGESGDLTVAFPYREGEIDKVSYTLENGFLNIIVKAGEEGLSFDERDIKYIKSKAAPELLFVVGSPKISDLGSLFNMNDLKNTTVVNIDNKADNQGFGDILFVSPRLSSVSEIMTSILYSMQAKMDRDIAQNLMIGLTYATDDFRSPKTSYLAFEMTGVLLRSGATRLGQVSQTAEPTRRLHGQNFEDQFLGKMSQPQTRIEDVERKQGQVEDPLDELQRKTEELRRLEKQAAQPRPEGQSFTKAPEGQASKPSMSEESFGKAQDEAAPEDWLTPKIYKGSTNF